MSIHPRSRGPSGKDPVTSLEHFKAGRRLNTPQQKFDSSVVAPALISLAEHSAFGVVLLDPSLRVEWASRHALKMLKGNPALSIRHQKFIVRDERIMKLVKPKTQENISTIELSMHEADAQSLLVSRLPNDRNDDTIVLLLFQPRAPRRLPQQTLHDIYQLTAAETVVLENLVSGLSLSEIACVLNISLHTVRTHVKRILVKCKVRSQAELVRLVLSGPMLPTLIQTSS